MDEMQHLQARVHALSIVTERLWANILTNLTSDPVEACRNSARESIASHDDLLVQLAERLGGVVPEDSQEFLHAIVHHEEEFWDTVEKRIGQIQAGNGTAS